MFWQVFPLNRHTNTHIRRKKKYDMILPSWFFKAVLSCIESDETQKLISSNRSHLKALVISLHERNSKLLLEGKRVRKSKLLHFLILKFAHVCMKNLVVRPLFKLALPFGGCILPVLSFTSSFSGSSRSRPSFLEYPMKRERSENERKGYYFPSVSSSSIDSVLFYCISLADIHYYSTNETSIWFDRLDFFSNQLHISTCISIVH